MPPRKVKQVDSLTLSDLEQVRVLADPLRLRILEELCIEERTTKQVAERLGEKPTKLYHHVDALERVGLIRLARTRQNRGTIEKYYLAVARQFRADSRLFSPGGAADVLPTAISTMFERTAQEMRGLMEGQAALAEQGIVSFLEIRASAAEGRRIQRKLIKLVKSLEEGGEAKIRPGQQRYRFTLAFYPLPAQ